MLSLCKRNADLGFFLYVLTVHGEDQRMFLLSFSSLGGGVSFHSRLYLTSFSWISLSLPDSPELYLPLNQKERCEHWAKCFSVTDFMRSNLSPRRLVRLGAFLLCSVSKIIPFCSQTSKEKGRIKKTSVQRTEAALGVGKLGVRWRLM